MSASRTWITPVSRQFAGRFRQRPSFVMLAFFLLLSEIALGSASTPADAAESPPDRVTLFQGPNFTGASRSWSLPSDQPFLAVPYLGDAFSKGRASIKIGSDVGVALLAEAFFASTDETCDYRLGTARDPALWWLSDGTDVLPGSEDSGPVEANLRDRPVASMIVFRRDLGPPPGALLLERRRYVNWSCPKPTKARGYKRLFIPVPAAPHAIGCFNLAVALSYPESAEVALDFSAASLLFLLLPRDLTERYRAVEHDITVSLYGAVDCEGDSVAFAHPGSEARRFDLKNFGLDRKARSVLIRYDGGAFDKFLPPPDQRPQVPVPQIVTAPAAPSEAAPAAQTAVQPKEPEPVVQDSAAPATSPPQPAASDKPAPAPEQERRAAQPAAAPETGAGRKPPPGEAKPTEQPSTPPAGALLLPESPAPATGQSETFKYPLLQGYRLNACLSGERDCGEPAADEWCKSRDFRKAVRWEIDENIGALFPTLAIGDLRLCASFVCDGFLEITCAQ